jgi:hypothetical protein
MSPRSIYYWTDGNPWHLEAANRLLSALAKAFGWGCLAVSLASCSLVLPTSTVRVAQPLPYGMQTFDCNDSYDSECQDLLNGFIIRQHI